MALQEGIHLEPDPVWTERYEAERERVEAASGDQLLGVFHVGSTAIPDLPGKPALDVLAVYETGAAMRGAAETLAEGAFELTADEDETILVIRWEQDSAVFVKMHLAGDEKATNQLLFREYLREHPAARREYEAVKREAAEQHPDDPQAYTQAKSEVVRSLLSAAREAGYDERLPPFL